MFINRICNSTREQLRSQFILIVTILYLKDLFHTHIQVKPMALDNLVEPFDPAKLLWRLDGAEKTRPRINSMECGPVAVQTSKNWAGQTSQPESPLA